jgi:hypothetical protein
MPFANAHEYRLAYRLKQAAPERSVFIRGRRLICVYLAQALGLQAKGFGGLKKQ